MPPLLAPDASPHSSALACWNPCTQAVLFSIEKLPASRPVSVRLDAGDHFLASIGHCGDGKRRRRNWRTAPCVHRPVPLPGFDSAQDRVSAWEASHGCQLLTGALQPPSPRRLACYSDDDYAEDFKLSDLMCGGALLVFNDAPQCDQEDTAPCCP